MLNLVYKTMESEGFSTLKLLYRGASEYSLKLEKSTNLQPSGTKRLEYKVKNTNQSQKTQGFRVADFATLSDERRLRSKIFLLFDMDKRTLRSKICRARMLEILGISQTKMQMNNNKVSALRTNNWSYGLVAKVGTNELRSKAYYQNTG